MFKNIFPYIVILVVTVLFFFLASCKKNETSSVAGQPVVVGYLIPGQPLSVKIYEQKGLTDTASYGALISGLHPEVYDGSTTIQLTESATGTYTHPDDGFLITGKAYKLQFTYNGTAVWASTIMPSKPVNYTASSTSIIIPARTMGNPVTGITDSVAVTFKWSNPDSLYHILVFKNDDTSPARVDLQYSRPINFTINPKQGSSYDMYYRSFNYYGTYRVILYRVNKEYSDALTSNTNTTSQKLTNAPTNVTNGFGIFTAMQADTIALFLN